MNKAFASLATSIFLVSTLSGCATVQPGERAVKVSMGVLNRNLIKPGVSTYNPLLDDLEVYSVKQETVEGSANPLTSDQQPISIAYKVQYKIPEGQLLNLYENVKGDPYQMLVVPQIQEAFRQVISQYKADAVTSGVEKIKGEVLATTRKNVNGLVDVVDIPITHIDLPAPLQAAIMEKQQMEIAAKKKQFELDRERKEAEITVTKAKAEAERIRLQSEALRQSPELVKYKMADVELEKARKWNGQLPQTVIGAGASTIFSLK